MTHIKKTTTSTAIALGGLGLLALGGCAGGGPIEEVDAEELVGAGAGAAVGALVAGEDDRLVGAAIGAAAGGLAGHYYDEEIQGKSEWFD